MHESEQKPKIIQVYNKKAKTTYLYEDTAYWDPLLKQGRHKRKGIGKLDDTGKAVYNDYYLNRLEEKRGQQVQMKGLSSTLMGENLILDKIIADAGLEQTLSKTIGKQKTELIMLLVKYIVCEGKPLCYAEEWIAKRHLSGLSLNVEQIMDLLTSLDKGVQDTFYKEWIAKKANDTMKKENNKNLLSNISSISSYAKDNPYLYQGQEQTHIALLCTYETNIPLWCAELPASLTDQVVLESLQEKLERLQVKDTHLLLDSRDYSEVALQALTDTNHTYTIEEPSHTTGQKSFIEAHKGELQRPANLITPEDKASIIYALTIPYGKVWVHLYYDALRKEREIEHLMRTLKQCQVDLEHGRPLTSREGLYNQFLESTEESGFILKDDALSAHINGCSGHRVIISTGEKDASRALSHLHKHGEAELHFNDLKNPMDCSLLGVHRLEGRLFLHFLALVVTNEMKRFIATIPAQVRGPWNHTMILNKVASYAKFHGAGINEDLYSVPTKAQRAIFAMFGIPIEDLVGKDTCLD